MEIEHFVHEYLIGFHARWVFWLLIVLFISIISIAVDRAIYLHKQSGHLDHDARTLHDLLQQSDYLSAYAAMSHSGSAAAAIVVAGLSEVESGPESAQLAMAGARALQRLRLERGLSLLGTLGNNTPFVGLLGTVIGIIGAFQNLAGTDNGDPAATSALMATIAEALVATALGLIVALPAVFAFNYFHRQVQTILAGSDALTNLLLAHLHRRPTT